MKVNPANVINILMEKYNRNNNEETPTNGKEIELAHIIIDLIDKYREAGYMNFETQQELIFDDLTDEPTSFDVPEDEEDLESASTSKPSSSSSPDESPEELEYGGIDLDYKQKAVDFWKSGRKRRLNFQTVKNKFKKLRRLSDLYRWEEQINKGGCRYDKLKAIAHAILQKFIVARNNKMSVHDIDLRRWATNENLSINLAEFQASSFWLWKFKENYNIVSRKTTKHVTRHHSNHLTDLIAAAEDFVCHVKGYFENYGASNIFNSDQSGFQLELHSGRTLSHKGEKETGALVQSISSTTHSYTIQPTISADGQLLSTLYIVLKEVKGQLGPRVRRSVFTAPNVHIEASTSGKLTKGLFRTWLTEVFLPSAPENSVLLLDSWN
ncbi:uncharacterized protein LOC143212802 [Lasioglossum baleicum]|uniref:uncharacterized protein LOC143212802 n=1 Tax=Lasioglossum baleicum TaxID=434251 RepID=UPI003FCD68BE